MKRYNQLSLKEKKVVQIEALNTTLEDIYEDTLFFDTKTQEHINKAIEEMERMKTPWFLSERLMEDEFLANKFKKWALVLTREAFYPKIEENILRI